ncbi:MAG: cysteine hydrolase [Lachnospiraceae bacterium]|nr:cysteine hydrolase [Lachnospiraceae bacterium]
MEELSLIAKETALLVIDMQNAFASLDGSIASKGADMSLCRSTIEPIKKLIEACREVGIIDIWTKQEHYPDDVTRNKHRIPPHTKSQCSVPPALVNTPDSDFCEDLKPYITDTTEIIRKHRFSAFLDTRLETLLRMKGIRFLIICGISTPLCVETTTRDAYQRDFDVIVVEDGTATTSKTLHENSLNVIRTYFGKVLASDEIVKLIHEAE